MLIFVYVFFLESNKIMDAKQIEILEEKLKQHIDARFDQIEKQMYKNQAQLLEELAYIRRNMSREPDYTM